MKGPTYALDRAVRSGRFAGASGIAPARVDAALSRRFGLSLDPPPRLWRWRSSVPRFATALPEVGHGPGTAYLCARGTEAGLGARARGTGVALALKTSRSS